VCVVWDCSSAGAWGPWRTPNLPSQVQPAGPVVAYAGGLEKHSAARRGSCPHASSNEGSEPSRSSMRRARASSKFSPWLGLGRRSASYWRWSVPSWSATKSKLPKQKLWSFVLALRTCSSKYFDAKEMNISFPISSSVLQKKKLSCGGLVLVDQSLGTF